MAETKFTPGPWGVCRHMESKEADEACTCGYRGGIWSGDGEQQVCEMGTTYHVGEEALAPPIPDRETTRANAHLIASAPDLYAALAAALVYVAKYESQHESNAALDVYTASAAALRSARGEK